MESNLVKNLVREPLLHFLLLGALIFVAFKFISRETSQPGKILITQGRIESLETAFSRTWRRPPSSKRIGRLDPRLRSRRSFRARSGRPRTRQGRHDHPPAAAPEARVHLRRRRRPRRAHR